MLGRFTKRPALVTDIPSAPAPVGEMPAPAIDLEPAPALASALPEPPAPPNSPLLSAKLLDAKVRLHRRLIEEINLSALEKLPEAEIRKHVSALVSQYIVSERLALNARELEDFVAEILAELNDFANAELEALDTRLDALELERAA